MTVQSHRKTFLEIHLLQGDSQRKAFQSISSRLDVLCINYTLDAGMRFDSRNTCLCSPGPSPEFRSSTRQNLAAAYHTQSQYTEEAGMKELIMRKWANGNKIKMKEQLFSFYIGSTFSLFTVIYSHIQSYILTCKTHFNNVALTTVIFDITLAFM